MVAGGALVPPSTSTKEVTAPFSRRASINPCENNGLLRLAQTAAAETAGSELIHTIAAAAGVFLRLSPPAMSAKSADEDEEEQGGGGGADVSVGAADSVGCSLCGACRGFAAEVEPIDIFRIVAFSCIEVMMWFSFPSTKCNVTVYWVFVVAKRVVPADVCACVVCVCV